MRESRTYGFVRGVPGHPCRDSQGEVGENLRPVGLHSWEGAVAAAPALTQVKEAKT